MPSRRLATDPSRGRQPPARGRTVWGQARGLCCPRLPFPVHEGEAAGPEAPALGSGAAPTSEPHMLPGQPAGPVRQVWVGPGHPSRRPGSWAGLAAVPGHTRSRVALKRRPHNPRVFSSVALNLGTVSVSIHCVRKYNYAAFPWLLRLLSESPSHDLGKQVGGR